MKTTSNGRSLSFLLAVVAFVFLFFGAPVFGQGVGASTGATVGKLEIKFIGMANVSETVVRANIQVREGGPFDEAAVDRDIRSLYRTGLFEFIEIKREQVSPTVVNLIVEVTSKYRVLSVEFDGNKHASTRRLRKEATTKPNASLDERNIKKDAEKIFEYYQKKGYSQAEVNYTIDRDRATGFGRVTFRIREGEKVRIKRIV
ncbi:MAG TPA: POTRA domain-containing protein, partial [Opitutaceae bacterium]|nr:POTRA domain-containing protein [Opitutaceae bacterium]